MRAYLSILLVPDPEGGGAEGGVVADNFPEVPMLLTVVLIRCSLDPNTCWVEADPTGTCRGTYPVLLGVEGRADGIILPDSSKSCDRSYLEILKDNYIVHNDNKSDSAYG